MKSILFAILAFKHPAFTEEKEIRFACLNRLEKKPKGYYNKSPYSIEFENSIPRLKIDFFPKAIKKIIIGPNSDQDKMKTLIRYQLEKSNFENMYDIEIIKSSIPFRSH